MRENEYVVMNCVTGEVSQIRRKPLTGLYTENVLIFYTGTQLCSSEFKQQQYFNKSFSYSCFQ
jgi:hypothetical protein